MLNMIKLKEEVVSNKILIVVKPTRLIIVHEY